MYCTDWNDDSITIEDLRNSLEIDTTMKISEGETIAGLLYKHVLIEVDGGKVLIDTPHSWQMNPTSFVSAVRVSTALLKKPNFEARAKKVADGFEVALQIGGCFYNYGVGEQHKHFRNPLSLAEAQNVGASLYTFFHVAETLREAVESVYHIMGVSKTIEMDRPSIQVKGPIQVELTYSDPRDIFNDVGKTYNSKYLRLPTYKPHVSSSHPAPSTSRSRQLQPCAP